MCLRLPTGYSHRQRAGTTGASGSLALQHHHITVHPSEMENHRFPMFPSGKLL